MLRRSATAASIGVVAALFVGLMPAPVAAQAPVVTLEASAKAIDFGQRVKLKGEVSPAAEGETVSIIDENGRERASTTTDANGRYRVTLAPRYTTTFQAQWLVALSDPERVKVRPKVTVSLGSLKLFGKGKVKGRVRPVQDSGRISVSLFTSGRRVFRRKVALRGGDRFSTSFTVRRISRHRVRATFVDEHGAKDGDGARASAPPLPYLAPGSTGVHVKLLERRLRKLGYHLDGTDRRYDEHTADAMRAFNKVEGRSRLGTVDSAAWRALASASRAKARFKTDGFHIEVNQTKQVLLTVRNGKVERVIHVSTGAPSSPTYDGTYHVFRKIAGYSGGRLYYPSYFDGLRALHGWPEVPTYNASHGCVRLPMWTAKWVYAQADMGTKVQVYH